MLKELYVVNENGQIEINFDALELVTSQEFVEEVKNCFGNGRSGMEIVSVNVDTSFSRATVILKGEYIVWVCRYTYGAVDSLLLDVQDLKVLKSIYEGFDL